MHRLGELDRIGGTPTPSIRRRIPGERKMLELVRQRSDLLPNTETEVAGVRGMYTGILNLGAVGVPLGVTVVHHRPNGHPRGQTSDPGQLEAPHSDDRRLAGPATLIARQYE